MIRFSQDRIQGIQVLKTGLLESRVVEIGLLESRVFETNFLESRAFEIGPQSQQLIGVTRQQVLIPKLSLDFLNLPHIQVFASSRSISTLSREIELTRFCTSSRCT